MSLPSFAILQGCPGNQGCILPNSHLPNPAEKQNVREWSYPKWKNLKLGRISRKYWETKMHWLPFHCSWVYKEGSPLWYMRQSSLLKITTWHTQCFTSIDLIRSIVLLICTCVVIYIIGYQSQLFYLVAFCTHDKKKHQLQGKHLTSHKVSLALF